MLNSPLPGDGLREGLVFHREQRGCRPWGITGPGWTLRDAGTGSCREFLPRSPPARALPWVFQAVGSPIFALGLSRVRGASEPLHAQPVVSSCPAASQDRAFLYPLKILQDLGVAAADPGSLVAPGRTEPKHPSGRGSGAATQPSNRLGPRLLRNHGVFLEGCGMENRYLCSERLEISWGGPGAEAD